MPQDLNDQFRSNHKSFYCVNGHGNVYNKKTTIEELENKLANEYSKNAQLEIKIVKLEKELDDIKSSSFFKKLFK
jgi:hypothetical protein